MDNGKWIIDNGLLGFGVLGCGVLRCGVLGLFRSVKLNTLLWHIIAHGFLRLN